MWSPGLSDGGDEVAFYRINFDQGLGLWTVLEEEVYGTDYLFSPLITGTTYSFKVEARNSVGFSEYSNTVSIKAAQIPDQPDAPTT
jgi:hypothetical protein